jgi:hypothetical protein
VGRLLQAKLRVSQPDDVHEQEAERVADQVMRMMGRGGEQNPVPGKAGAATAPGSHVQRALTEEEEEDEESLELNRQQASGADVVRVEHFERPQIQRMCSACEEKEVQRQVSPEEEEEEEEELQLSRKRADGADVVRVGQSERPQISRKCSTCEEEEVQRQASPEEEEEEDEIVQRQASPEEEEEEDELLQPKRESGGGSEAPSSVDAYVGGASHGGQPLSSDLRAQFEPRFGYDFSQVRVHTDAGAAESAQSVNALAYTVGRNVIFGAGQYAPQTSTGQRLLAHELTHVVQQGHAEPSVSRVSDEHVATASTSPAVVARVVQPVIQRQSTVIDPTLGTITQAEADKLSLEELDRLISNVTQKLAVTPIISTEYDGLEQNLHTLQEARKKKSPLEKDDLQWEEEEQEEGTELQKPGIVSYDGFDKGSMKAGKVTDVALREFPTTSSKELKRLPVNTRLFVDRELMGDWFYVILDDGTAGYIMKGLVNTDLPDPQATLHRIKTGESALDIVRQYYKGDAIEWGQDARFYVNVLVLVNQEAGRKWIYKPSESASWDETKTIAGGQIWIPGREFAKSLHGVVSSGSISYETWATVRDLVVGTVAFIAGILHGALESIVDIFVGIYDLLKMVYDILKSLITGEIVNDITKLWNDVSNLKYEDVKAAFLGWLDDKWNHPSVWSRWHFRGWVIGYAIAEIAMFFFTGGAATAAKWAGKGAKIAGLIAKFPTIVKLGKAAKALTGPPVDAMRAALKGVKALSAAHAWAKKTLGIPYKILVNVSEEAAERLRKLPVWAQERFADLNHGVMRWLLGCASPCKVDVHAIEKYLKEVAPAVAKAAKKLTSEADIVAALPKSMKTGKILDKLKTRPALLKAITEAGLTDVDFIKLADFLSDADKASPAAAYRTFVRYVTNVVPAKVGGNLDEFNRIAAAMIKADPRQGAALKGPMFEMFAKLNVPDLGGKAFQKVKFTSSGGKKLTKPRTADNFVPDKGELWDIKHSMSAVPVDQAADYALIVGMKTPAGDVVKSINYLFPTEAAAKASGYLKSTYGFRVFYIGAKNALIPL